MIELRRFKNIVRWWWLAVLSTLIAAGISYYVSSREPRIYQTTTTLMVGEAIQKTNPGNQDFFMAEQLGRAYAQMVNREPVLQATIDSLGLEMGWQTLTWQVSAWQVPQTQLLQVSVTDTSPERAVVIADEIAYQLILQTPTSPLNEARQQRGSFVLEQLDDLERRIQAAQERMKELEKELDAALSANQIKNLQGEINNLQTLINGWQTNYTSLLSFLDGSGSPNTLAIIEPAVLPTDPISPNVKANVVLAAITGLMLAVAAAVLLEYIDNSVKSLDDLGLFSGLTPLGSILRISGKEPHDKLITQGSPFSMAAEAYRVVRSNLQFAAADHRPRTMMTTSPGAGEGKSMTAANLAAIMAQADFKTILVDADLRRPALHHLFKLPNTTGLTDLLDNPTLPVEEVWQNGGVENLQIITSGPLPPNPAERLSSQRMFNLLERLTVLADTVIFDSPPIMAVTDAAALANQLDGVILVMQAKRTTRGMVKKAMERLSRVRANVLGGVLNQAGGNGEGYYDYSQVQSQPALPRRGQSKERSLPQRVA